MHDCTDDADCSIMSLFFNETCRLLISQRFVNESVPLFLPDALRRCLLTLVERTVLERIQNQFLDGSQVLLCGCDAEEGEVEVVGERKCAPE